MGFALKLYNKQQQEIIKHASGPLLVISGAGTGKTHVLTGRILYLILEKGVKPEEILALTFTEKAAQEMIQRVETALPLGFGEIWIKTFHGFADSILKEKSFEIGLSTDYKLLGEADVWLFLKRHLMDFNLNYYRPLGNPQKFLRSMHTHFSKLQDEDITPDQYSDYTKKQLNKAKTDEEHESAIKQLELANAYKKYEELSTKEGCLDFAGLLFYTLRLFEKRKSVLDEFQDRFKYILVDEFQDTNFAQNKIITLFSQKNKNLMVVGDDDQSIYKWRGASLTNIKYFQKIFPKAKTITLNDNYRSHQAILDFAHASIQKNNPNRLEHAAKVDKKLKSAVSYKKILPEIYHFQSFDEEIESVVSKANSAFKQNMDVAILVRTNQLAIPFLERLKLESLPFQHFAQTDLFSRPGVKDCMAVLRVIADPTDNLAMFKCLSMSFWKILMIEILKLVKQAKISNLAILDLLQGQKLGKIKMLFLNLIELARTRSVSEIMMKFLNESGYLKYVSENSMDSEVDKIQDIAGFSEKIKNFEETHPNKTVIDFLEFAQLLEEVGERNSTDQTLEKTSIKVLTVHSAKGLEFDAVFVPGLVNGKFPAVSRRDPFEIPQELIKESLPSGNLHLEEERRLFYVASTRAKKQLTLTYSDFYDSKRQWKPSPFILEITGSGKCLFKEKSGVRISKFQTQLPLPERIHKPIKLDLKKISYSQLDTFKTCPLKYQFRHIYNLPTPSPAVLNFGLSIHNALKNFYEFLARNPKKTQEDLKPVLKELFEKNWIPFGYETKALQEDQKRRGYELLEKYYLHEKNSLTIPAFIEQQFDIKIEKIILAGRIDRIDKLPDGTYEVIDYKTGENKEKNMANDLQLSIYALACRDVLKIPVSRLSLYFLENLEKVSTTRNDMKLNLCKEEILKAASEISSSDFSPAPGYHCGFCDYKAICEAAKPVLR